MALTKSVSHEMDLDRTVFAFLSGLTHEKGLAFNRAIFLKREGEYLREAYAIGPRDYLDGQRLYGMFAGEKKCPPLEDIVKGEISFNREPYGVPDIYIKGLPSEVCVCKPGEHFPPSLFEILGVKEAYFLPLLDRNDFIAAVLVDNFITGRKCSEEKLKILCAISLDYSTLWKIKEVREKDELYHTLSHRVRTDLSGSYALIKQAIKKESFSTNEMLLVAKKMWTTLTAINDLLQFAVIESGNFSGQARFSFCDVERLIRSAANEVLPFGTERLHIRTQCKWAIWSDEEKLNHALTNMLDNAVLYSLRESPIYVTAEIPLDGTDQIAISVESQSVNPVAASEMERLFEKFFRGNNSKNVKGTGLGLYIVDHVARLHGGRAAVSLLPDNGVVFKLIIPAVPRASE